jgi:hypothetical protein
MRATLADPRSVGRATLPTGRTCGLTIQEAFAMHRTAIVEEFRIVRADDKTLRRMERRGTTSLRQ